MSQTIAGIRYSFRPILTEISRVPNVSILDPLTATSFMELSGLSSGFLVVTVIWLPLSTNLFFPDDLSYNLGRMSQFLRPTDQSRASMALTTVPSGKSDSNGSTLLAICKAANCIFCHFCLTSEIWHRLTEFKSIYSDSLSWALGSIRFCCISIELKLDNSASL